MFGGGAEAGRADDSFPVRPTSIRGHLQFWWRATHGASCADAAELARRQAEVWGTTEQASRVRIEVRDPQSTPHLSWAELKTHCESRRTGQDDRQLLSRSRKLGYALFSFKEEKPRDKPEARFIEELSFTLHIECSTPPGVGQPSLKPAEEILREVETAARAWVNFGGLGARTRRGCGALLCEKLVPKDVPGLRDWMQNTWSGASSDRGWPTLPSRILARPEPGRPIEVWEYLIGFWQHFRQGEGFARNTGQGRSRYPEPETIREITGRRSKKHPRLDQIPADAFPRAELGLPIVFHFKDSSAGEPHQTTLYPADLGGLRLDRMASPLILKPLALADGQAVPLIMQLDTPPLHGVDLREGNVSRPLPETTSIRGLRLSRYPNSPLASDPDGSALGAFERLALSENNFVEIAR